MRAPIPDTGSKPAGTTLFCANHPTVIASRHCIQCGLRCCPTCAVPKDYGRTALETCPRCGGLLRAFDPAAAAEARGQVHTARRLRGPPFYARPWKWLAYPFSGPAGPISLAFFGLLQALIFMFARTSVIGFLGWLIFQGLVLSFLAYVVRRVDLGEERISAPIEFLGVWEDVYRPFLALVVVTLPLWVATIVARGSWTQLLQEPVALGFLIYGLAVLPGGVLWATNFGGFWDLVNPVKHLSIAWKAPVAYIAALAGTLVLFAAYVALSRLLVGVRPTFLADCVDGAAHAYFGLVAARMYGLMLRQIQPEPAVTP